jgi:hypothetical protein
VWNFDTNKHGKPTLHSKTVPKDDKNHPKPFRTSLNARDRYQIVRATSDFTISGRADVQAERLWLSARGGFLESDGVWEGLPNKTFDLEEWKHLATLGRDHYVKVVTKGFLFPFGHHVVQVKVTERHFEQVGSQVVATSREVIYLVVKQTVKSYDPAQTFGVANDSRDLPFRSIELKTLRTPDLDPSPPVRHR